MTVSFVRSTIKAALWLIGGLLAIWIIAAVLLVSLIDFDKAQKEPVPHGLYHLWACMWVGCNPLKVIDPADPEFQPESFRFEDYPTKRHLAYVIEAIIGPGMDRSAVEEILVHSGDALVRESADGMSVYYSYPNKADNLTSASYAVAVKYAGDSRVSRVWVNDRELTLNPGEAKE